MQYHNYLMKMQTYFLRRVNRRNYVGLFYYFIEVNDTFVNEHRKRVRLSTAHRFANGTHYNAIEEQLFSKARFVFLQTEINF